MSNKANIYSLSIGAEQEIHNRDGGKNQLYFQLSKKITIKHHKAFQSILSQELVLLR